MLAGPKTHPLAGWPGVGKIIVVIPAYNEARFIGSVVLAARQHAHQVIVIDDGSSDDTACLAELAGARVLRHACNQGKGAALCTGFQAAGQDCPAVVVMLDADGQHNATELERLAQPILAGRADIVIGSRYLAPTSAVPYLRVWGHRFFNLLTGAASGLPASDSQSGFRAFSLPALRVMALHSRGFAVESEMQFIARQHHLRLEEVPVTIRYLDRPKRPVWQHGLFVLNGILRLVGQMRPLLFFGLPGSVVLLIGLALGVAVVDIYNRTLQLAVGYAVLSGVLTIIGTIGLETGIILHSVRGQLIEIMRVRFKDSKAVGAIDNLGEAME